MPTERNYTPNLIRQSQGSLIVEVTTDPLIGPIKPLPDVKVTIKQMMPDNSQVTIAELLTDGNGQTPTIKLDAPPRALSQVPEEAFPPYSSYIVEVFSQNYLPVVVYGTQIFPDTLSIQPIRLIPIVPTRKYTRQIAEEITIGEPTLYGDYAPKIPESEIKNTSAPGFIVLDSVVVPEFVVVHAGSPNNTSAPNYTVPFKDYIKNVASSEIYPTWPTETIKANVIAIVSFTLNRVYTEWYRNKGKNFTITNSTAFDHAYVPGRDIFDTISVVVDEVFDTYIKLPGVTQPLLSQYCDGAKVSCPNWMTKLYMGINRKTRKAPGHT